MDHATEPAIDETLVRSDEALRDEEGHLGVVRDTARRTAGIGECGWGIGPVLLDEGGPRSFELDGVSERVAERPAE